MNFSGVSEQSQTRRSPLMLSLIHNIDRFIKIVSRSFNIAVLQPPLYRALIDLDCQGDPIIHCHGQRLRSTHLSEARGENDSSSQAAPKMLPSGSAKRFIGALENPLSSNVRPGTGGHLSEHYQAFLFEFVEVIPCSPFGD